MNILITGGAGFIGSNLAEKILNEGNKVTIIDDLSTGKLDNINHLLKNPNIRFVNDSILNTKTIDTLIKNSETIFHLAAAVGVYLIVKDPVKVIETNILGTHKVLESASKYNKKVLIAEGIKLKKFMDNYPKLMNVEDYLHAPGIEWEIN